MASVMATESEVFGSCVGEINVSVGMGKQVPGFAVGGYNWDLFWREKWLKFGDDGS
jgi:hypothetical protein